MKGGTWAWVAALTLVFLTRSGVVAGPAPAPEPPPLPEIALETFPDDAREALKGALDAARARPEDPEAAGGLGLALQAWEQWQSAHEAYLRAQALAPANPQWFHLDGIVLQRIRQPAQAAEKFARAWRLAPERLAILARLAESLFDAGALDDSERRYRTLADTPASAPVGQLGLGRLAAVRGRHAEAVAHFDRAIALFPEFGAAHYARAQSLRALGRRDEARKALAEHRKHGTAWPGIPDEWAALVDTVREDPRGRFLRGLRRAANGDLAGAIEDHEAAVAVKPHLAQPYVNLISLYGRAQQWARAEAAYRAVVELGYNLDDAHYNYGVLLDAQQRYEEAAAAYRKALAVNPFHALAHNNLGQALERERKFAEAAEQYRQAIVNRPSFRLARFNLGRMKIATGDFDGAIRELEPLREPVDDETPRYLFALAVAMVQGGRRAEGVAMAKEARALALRFSQTDLARAIDRDLNRLR